MAKTLVVASRNPVKLAAAEQGFRRLFAGVEVTVEGVSVPSGVADQPRTDVETLTGAENRARSARQQVPSADFWVGLEGGLEERDGGFHAFAWVVALGTGSDTGVVEGRSRTASFELPPPVAELVRQGMELGHADDQVFGRSNSKQGAGAVGLVTEGLIDRQGLYEPAVVLALVPFFRPDLYGSAG